MDVIIPVGDMPVTAQVTTPGKAIVAAQVNMAGYEQAMQAADTANTAATNADASAANADAATAAAKAATESASSASASATESAAKADQATADAQAATTAAQTATEAAKSATDAANVATSNADAATDRANAAAENAESIASGAVATTETVGVVKASASVPVAEDGTMSVNLGAADGTLPVAHGGTGATTAAAALANLGAATASDMSTAKTDITELQSLVGRTRNDITPLVRDGTLSEAVRANDLAARGLKVGDYFTGKSGYTYHLADMDTFYGGYNSYAVVAQHHAVIVVDTHTHGKWNDAADTSNGYVSSKLHALLVNTHLPVIRSDIADLTGDDAADHLIAHSKLYTTKVQNGHSSSFAWSSGQYISALTEMQVYGGTVWSSSGYDTGEAFRQLGVFAKFDPNLLFGNDAVWLRDVDNAAHAAYLGYSGSASVSAATDQLRVAGLILFH